MAYAPGPWTANGTLLNSFTLLDGSGTYIGVFNQGGNDLQQGEANARLIAAAPDLLAACETLLEAQRLAGYTKGITAFEEMAKAVARAREGS